VLARAFVFEKVGGCAGVNGEKEMDSAYRVTSIPRDGMRMKARLSDRAEERAKKG
jgi:hypothetical protein